MDSTLKAKFDGKSLSDYWRIDQSEDRISELTSILEGARACTSLLEGTFSVNWASPLHSGKARTISLDSAVLTGFAPPYPGKVVDVVIGLALHEVGHERWTRPFPKGKRINSLSTMQHGLLHRIHNILEDAYVDTNMGRESNVLGEYISSMRKAFVSDRVYSKTQKLLKEEPNRKNIIEVWSGIALYNIALETEEVNQSMLDMAIWLLDETMKYVDLKSHKARTDRAWKIFLKIDALPAAPISPPPSITGTASSEDVNPWINEEPEPEEEGESDEGVAVESEPAPAYTNMGDEREDDWYEEEDEVRKDDEEEPDKADSDASGSDEEGLEEDAEGEPVESEGSEEDDGSGGETGGGGGGGMSSTEEEEEEEGEGDEEDFAGEEEGEGTELSADSDTNSVSEKLLDNLTSGDESSLTDLTDYLDRRKPEMLDDEDALAVDEAETNERKDMSGVLSREIGIGRQTFVSQKAEYNHAAHHRVKERTHRESQRLNANLRKIDEVGARWRYGTSEGKLDTRRLPKAATNRQTIYKRRDARGKSSIAFVLLLDVSASMDMNYADVADTAAIFSEAVQGIGYWYEIAAYTDGGSTASLENSRWVMNPRRGSFGRTAGYTILGSIDQPLSLDKVGAGGMTPSGRAIATAVYRVKNRAEKHKVVIHFTDGYPNDGNDLYEALRYARKVGVDVLTVSVGQSQEGMYGKGRARTISTVSELPEAIQQLLAEIY